MYMAYLDLKSVLSEALRQYLPLPSKLKEGVENTYLLYDFVRTAWDVDLVVDSSKNVRQAVELFSRHPDQMKLIFLVRDGRGVFNSGLRSGFGMKDSLDSWLKYNTRALSYFDRLIPDGAVHFIKYEDLIGNAKNTLEQACEFIGIEFQDQMLDMASTECHIFNGNDTRFKRNSGLKLDEKWRVQLEDHELAYFDRKASKMNRKLGYV